MQGSARVLEEINSMEKATNLLALSFVQEPGRSNKNIRQQF